jgi:hypothetical protein
MDEYVYICTWDLCQVFTTEVAEGRERKGFQYFPRPHSSTLEEEFGGRDVEFDFDLVERNLAKVVTRLKEDVRLRFNGFFFGSSGEGGATAIWPEERKSENEEGDVGTGPVVGLAASELRGLPTGASASNLRLVW